MYDVYYMTTDEHKELIEHLLMAEEVLKWVNKWKWNRRGQRILHQVANEGCALTAPVKLICCFVHNPTE